MPMAISQARIRPQSPMLTTSEMAPIVQKLVLLAKKPKIMPRPKPAQTTVFVMEPTSGIEVLSPAKLSLSPEGARFSRKRAPLGKAIVLVW